MPAEIIAIESVYFTRARQYRGLARMLKETKRFTEALVVNAEARRMDNTAYCIQAKADAAARARARDGGDLWTDAPMPLGGKNPGMVLLDEVATP